MLLHRPERIAFKIDEAMVLLEYRNLKGKNNRYLEKFKQFIEIMENLKVNGVGNGLITDLQERMNAA